MTDRNLDYDYASKQRVLISENYQGHTAVFDKIVNLWTAEGKTEVDGTEGVVFLRIDATDAWEYDTRDGVPVLRLNWDTDTSDWRSLLFSDFPSVDYSRNFRLSGRFYYDETSVCVISNNWARYDLASAVTVNLTLENEPGYRSIKVGSQMPDPTTQIPTWLYEKSSLQTWTTPGWLWWVYDWDTATNTWTGRAWDVTDGGVTLVTHSPNDFIDRLSPQVPLYMGFLTYIATGQAEIAWLKLEYTP